jgi:hypothetical protein
LLGFPQFHRTHHNNKLYSFQKSVNTFLVVIVGGEKRATAVLCRPAVGASRFHAFPQVLRAARALYFAKKRVEYDSGGK